MNIKASKVFTFPNACSKLFVPRQHEDKILKAYIVGGLDEDDTWESGFTIY